MCAIEWWDPDGAGTVVEAVLVDTVGTAVTAMSACCTLINIWGGGNKVSCGLRLKPLLQTVSQAFHLRRNQERHVGALAYTASGTDQYK